MMTAGILPLTATAADAEIQARLPSFSVNTSSPTIVGFGGKQWAVIGYDSVGNTTQRNTLTLLLANGQSYSTSEFDSTNTSYAYIDSTLQGEMSDKYAELPAKEQGVVIGRTLDSIAGDPVEGAKFWPLSFEEANSVNSEIRKFSTYWWLRSPVYIDGNAAIVLGDGYVDDYGAAVNIDFIAVRPAFNLNLSSVVFTSAGVGGKPAAVGSSLELASAPGGAVKFTMLDSSMALDCTDTAARTVKMGDKLNIAFSGATTGANNYVSCVIETGIGAVVYYGKLAQNLAAGTASFTVPVLPNGNYTIKLFAEEANGDNYTDFCSAPVSIPMTVVSPVPDDPTPTPTITPDSSSDFDDVPKTGDDSMTVPKTGIGSNYIFWICVCTAALGLSVVVIIKLRSS